MAFQKDYVLRLIEMMGDFLRRLKMIGQEWQRDMEINMLCRDQCGLSLDAAEGLSEETLMELLPPRGLLTLSELMYLRAEAVAMDELARQRLYLRTLRLLSSLHEEETLCEERGVRLRKLMDLCGEEMEISDYLSCARFFLSGERLTDCEDAIFMAVELAREPGDVIREGRGLLMAMLQLPDSALILAGMPRQDVIRAIEDLEAWEIT